MGSDTKDCQGKANKAGSVTLEGHGVGFLCDNPKKSSDLADVPCFPCFTKEQCKKPSVNKFFPIKRSLRVAKFVFLERSRQLQSQFYVHWVPQCVHEKVRLLLRVIFFL